MTVSALRSGFAITSEQDRGHEPAGGAAVRGRRHAGATSRRPSVSPDTDEGAVVGDAVGAGDDLWLLLRTTNRAGAGTRLLVQPTG